MDEDALLAEVEDEMRAVLSQAARATLNQVFTADVKNKMFTLTGDGPCLSSDVTELLTRLGAFAFEATDENGHLEFTESDVWDDGEAIIIGHHGFNVSCLSSAVASGRDINFIAQDDFLNYLLFGAEPGYVQEDGRIEAHAGLAFLASKGFRWPSVFALPGDGSGQERERDAQSWLMADYGYNVRASTLLGTRLRSLHRAVEEKGLQDTAELVAWLARSRKRIGRDNLKEAIERYEADLAWLKRKYYDGTTYSFVWPSI